MDRDIPWNLGIDLSHAFLPLDEAALVFPGASAEQELAISQFMGLVVNATVSEMEEAMPSLKHAVWQKVLDDYPVGPEMQELGELFFAEEAKHASAFVRFLDLFCTTTGIERPQLDRLLPKAFGSQFQRRIIDNALTGGHAFWWVAATVEEVSVAIYPQMVRSRQSIDPLYFQLHRRHLEEESRHANYAFLMLHMTERLSKGWKGLLHRKTDYLLSQMASAPWIITELYKFFEVRKLKDKHPFFATLASCIPLFESLPRSELMRRMFIGAPYISWLLNPGWRTLHVPVAKSLGALVPPFPEPDSPVLRVRPLAT